MNKLSKEETIDLAHKGNTAAMVILGGYYNKLAIEGEFNDDYFQEAKKWYSLAEEKGNLVGAYRYILCLAFEANVLKQVDFIGSKENWELLLQKTLQLIYKLNQNKLDIESIDINSLYKTKRDGIYYLSIIYYFEKDINKAYNLISENDDSRSKILNILCQIELNSTTDPEKYDRNVLLFEENMKFLKSFFEQSDSYRRSKKTYHENLIYNMAVLTVCKYYSSLEQHEEAVKLLNLVLDSDPNNQSNDMLIEELSHYKKKLFGGYKYIQ